MKYSADALTFQYNKVVLVVMSIMVMMNLVADKGFISQKCGVAAGGLSVRTTRVLLNLF